MPQWVVEVEIDDSVSLQCSECVGEAVIYVAAGVSSCIVVFHVSCCSKIDVLINCQRMVTTYASGRDVQNYASTLFP